MPKLRPILFAILFTGLIIAGAYVTVPLGPVPFVLSDFFVLLSGLVLGKKYAPIAVGAYLALGAFGLPVFADGGGGISHYAGPTGGYLIGFLISSYIVGAFSHTVPRSTAKDLAAVLTGYVTIYTCGVIWLKFHADLLWYDAIYAGALNFIVPMAIKSTSAVLLALLFRKSKLRINA